MRNFLVVPAMMFVFLANSQGFAGPCPPGSSSSECIEVEAPDLSGEGGGGMPGTTIGGAIGGAHPGVGGGSGASAAKIDAKGHQDAESIKEKKQTEEGEVTEESLLDALLQLIHPQIEATRYAMDKVAEIYNLNVKKSWWKETVKRDPKTGIIETTREGSCVSVQVGAKEKKPGCAEVWGTQWKDPSDGRQKMVITIREFHEVPKAKPTAYSKFDRVYRNPITFVVEKPEDIYTFFQAV